MEIIENRSAQFMLLAGFIIAIGLVITTVVLNSIIFEINTATGTGSDPSKNEIINLMQITKDEIRSAYRYANLIGGTAESMDADFNKQMINFNRNLSKLYALHGENANINWNENNWINGRYANFTQDGTENGATSWIVMESVKNVTIFELKNVSGSNFEIKVSNQTTGAFLWSLRLDGNDNVSIKNSSSFIEYRDINFTYIDLLNTSWGSHQFSTNVGSNISKITFLNGSDASGKFKIAGNTTYRRDFIRARDYLFNATVTLSTSRIHASITIPVSVPW